MRLHSLNIHVWFFKEIETWGRKKEMVAVKNESNEVMVNKDDLMKIIEMTGLPASSLERLIDLRKAEEQEAEQRKRERDNPPFVQLYKGTGTKAIQWLFTKNAFAGQLFLFFLENMNNKNLVVASQQLLIEEFGKGRTTIYRAIKFLEEHNFINVARIGSANAYILNPEIAFQDGHDKKKYVAFEGTILLSKEENKNLLEKYNYENIKVLKEKNK